MLRPGVVGILESMAIRLRPRVAWEPTSPPAVPESHGDMAEASHDGAYPGAHTAPLIRVS